VRNDAQPTPSVIAASTALMPAQFFIDRKPERPFPAAV
jgi:hypothetical protein